MSLRVVSRSLGVKLVLAAVIVVVLVVTLVLANTVRILNSAIEEQMRARIDEMGPILSVALAPAVFRRDYTGTQEFLDGLLAGGAGSLRYLVALDDQGARIALAGAAPDPLPAASERSTVLEETVHMSLPLRIGPRQVGELRLGLSYASLADARTAVLREGAALVLAGIAMTVFALGAVGYLLTRHLHALLAATSAVAAGRYDVAVQVASADEVGELARRFNEMVAKLRSSMQSLRDGERRFRALVDLSSDWYWATDASHRFTVREGAILRRMGIPPEADYGKQPWEIGFLNLSEADWAAHRAALERREEFRDLLLGRRGPHSRVHWATISGKPLYDDAGGFLGYHGTGRDVTAQVEAEQALRELNKELERKVAERTAELAAANKELEAFAYSVSHDLRAPLRGIDGFSQVLVARHGARLDPEARRMLERIRNGAQRMGDLITDLLQLSRVVRSVVQSVAVDLSALVQEMARELQDETGHRVVEWCIEPGMMARGDRALLRVALANLLDNALKYTRDISPARIECGVARRSAGFVEFFVRDNGAGFDMAYAARLFQPFQRLHAVHEFEGTGIGLATVKRIIAKHGGEVRGEGRPGGGATFYFTLPA